VIVGVDVNLAASAAFIPPDRTEKYFHADYGVTHSGKVYGPFQTQSEATSVIEWSSSGDVSSTIPLTFPQSCRLNGLPSLLTAA
jgi:hypothetical protein